MKRISLFLILLLCIAMAMTFAGCRSTKTTSKTISKTEFKKDSVGESTQKNSLVSTDNSTEDTDITVREYNTALPVDSTTGKPPIMRETIISHHRHNEKKTEAKAEASAKAKVKQSGSNKATGNTETKIRSPVWPLSWRWSSAIVIALLLICDFAFNRARIMLWLAKRIVGIFRRK